MQSNNRTSPLLIASLMCLLTTAALRAQTRTDTIIPVTGTAIRGTVTAANRDEITLDVRGTPRKIPANAVQRIVFGNAPSALRQAHEALGDGQFANALESLTKIQPAQVTDGQVAEDLAFQSAYCKAMLGAEAPGGTAAAATEMLDFLKKYPTSFHFYRAAETLGDLAMRLGNYDRATTYYAQLGRAPWQEYKLKAAVLEAGALQAQGPEKYAEALQRYDVVAGASVRGPEAERQKQFALAGKAACEAELGNTDAARKAAEQIIQDNDPDDVELFARAYNALGASYRKTNNPRDAILAYLHVDLLCHRARDAHAEALYYLSQLWNEVGKADRATEARNTLKSRYGGTTWANR